MFEVGSISASLSCLVYPPFRGRRAGSFPEQRLVIEPIFEEANCKPPKFVLLRFSCFQKSAMHLVLWFSTITTQEAIQSTNKCRCCQRCLLPKSKVRSLSRQITSRGENIEGVLGLNLDDFKFPHFFTLPRFFRNLVSACIRST